MERFNLTTPETKPNITFWQIVGLNLSWDNPNNSIIITLKGSNGETKTISYTDLTARTLMNQLNTANLSTISLHKRIMNRLVADGYLTGTVAGAPD